MSKFKSPDELDLKSANLNAEWKMFNQLWTNYEIASGLDKQDSKKRVATLLTIIGKEAVKIFNTFKWENATDKEDITKVLKNFEKYCTPRKNVTYERYIFHTRKQNANENVDEYITSLRILAGNCEFGDIEESLIKDMLVLGVNDKKLRENMLLDPELTLDKAISMAKTNERTKVELDVIEEDSKKENETFAVRREKGDNKAQKECWFCGSKHVFGRENCPAYGKSCHNCNGRNHFSAMCKKKRAQVNEVDDESQEFVIY